MMVVVEIIWGAGGGVGWVLSVDEEEQMMGEREEWDTYCC